MFEVKNHVLMCDGKPVTQRSSPNIGGVIKPRLLVMHYTASQRAAGAIAWLCNPAAKASAHIVIDTDGTVTQLVPLNRRAWHAGVSAWKGVSDCNAFSIGIEMANPGPLRQMADGTLTDANGQKYPKSQAAMLAHRLEPKVVRPWATYPVAQQAAAVAIAQAICATYGIKEIVGHDDIAPTRKRDPGPAWPMASFTSKVFGRQGKAA